MHVLGGICSNVEAVPEITMIKHRLSAHCLALCCQPKPLAYTLQHLGNLHLNLLALTPFLGGGAQTKMSWRSLLTSQYSR